MTKLGAEAEESQKGESVAIILCEEGFLLLEARKKDEIPKLTSDIKSRII